MRRGLIVFARDPLPGRVKSRLAAGVGEAVAAELYEAMLADVLETCRGVSCDEVVAWWDCAPDRLAHLERRFAVRSQRQVNGDLGRRMATAFDGLLADGCEACCIIGSDAPDLPAARIEQAFAGLELPAADAVFGPATDGGYYLLGLRTLLPELFEAIPWSTERVLAASLAALRARDRRALLLDAWSDIDTPADLQAFIERIPSREGRRTRAALAIIQENVQQ